MIGFIRKLIAKAIAKASASPFGYPKPLETYFDEGLCPDCGNGAFSQWQDGGHDAAIECTACGSRFGIQQPPFNMIERIGASKNGTRKAAA